jgi:hypothetical protein
VMGDGNSSETKNTEVDNQNPDIDPGENDFRFTGTSRHVMLIVATGPHTFFISVRTQDVWYPFGSENTFMRSFWSWFGLAWKTVNMTTTGRLH